MPEIDPETDALAEALRSAINRSRHSLRQVEDAMGMGRDYLSQLLRGNVDLKVKHVYAVLRVIGEPPADFFAALHPRGSGQEVVAGLPQVEFDRVLAGALERLGYDQRAPRRREPRREEGGKTRRRKQGDRT